MKVYRFGYYGIIITVIITKTTYHRIKSYSVIHANGKRFGKNDSSKKGRIFRDTALYAIPNLRGFRETGKPDA